MNSEARPAPLVRGEVRGTKCKLARRSLGGSRPLRNDIAGKPHHQRSAPREARGSSRSRRGLVRRAVPESRYQHGSLCSRRPMLRKSRGADGTSYRYRGRRRTSPTEPPGVLPSRGIACTRPRRMRACGRRDNRYTPHLARHDRAGVGRPYDNSDIQRWFRSLGGGGGDSAHKRCRRASRARYESLHRTDRGIARSPTARRHRYRTRMRGNRSRGLAQASFPCAPHQIAPDGTTYRRLHRPSKNRAWSGRGRRCTRGADRARATNAQERSGREASSR